MADSNRSQDIIEEIKKIRDTPGYVYLIRNKDLYKIGITMSIERRFKQLKPDDVLEVMQMPNTRGTEKLLHERFKHRRIPQSEYFRLTTEEIEEARYLFQSVRGEAPESTTKSWMEISATLKKTSSRKSNINYSASSAEWIEIIEQVGRGCAYEKMLWTEATTSTGKVVTGSYYILNVLDEECLLPRSGDLMLAIKRIEIKDDYLLPVAKAETENEAAESAIILIGDILLALCWGYWQGLFDLKMSTGGHPKPFIEKSEEFLRGHGRWYTTHSPTQRKRLERMRGWGTPSKLFGIF